MNTLTTNSLTLGTPGQASPANPAVFQPEMLESEDFASVFKSMLVSVNQSQQHSRQLTESFDLGQHQDLAGVMIAQQKSKLAFQSTLQVRNKLMTAYQDVMNMPV
ncbi:MAG TPA: flagellar hook-basal body complex protein FliE [Gammaproteobacteria bacterium]|nr:flagellar hook-basal body complex protein FliE [Gammaproteobacteria bacterium]